MHEHVWQHLTPRSQTLPHQLNFPLSQSFERLPTTVAHRSFLTRNDAARR